MAFGAAAGILFGLVFAGHADEAAAASRNYYKAPVVRAHNNNTPPRYGVVRHRNWTNAVTGRRFESRARKTGSSVYKHLHPDGPPQSRGGAGRGGGLYYYAGSEKDKDAFLLFPPRLYPPPPN